ncbi:MAG: hypothetical protein II202_05950, partial [Bacteroidales bacterium]|nr:hypothetical protein [Bacteroidales bacterium]
VEFPLGLCHTVYLFNLILSIFCGNNPRFCFFSPKRKMGASGFPFFMDFVNLLPDKYILE